MQTILSNSRVHRVWSPVRGLAVVLAMAAGLGSASAAIVFVAGDHTLQPNQPDQLITISVNNTGAPFDIDGFNLTAVVGDGGPVVGGTPAPVIGGPGGVDLHTGTPFGPTYNPAFPELDVFASENLGAFELAQWTIASAGPVSVPSGLSIIGTIRVDTTGFGPSDGPWLFSLAADLPGVGQAQSEFVLGGETLSGATFEDGSFTIVPEPEVWASGTGAALLIAAVIRKRLKARTA